MEIFEGELVNLPLMPSTVTLGELRVDGEQATVIEEQGQFVTVVKGRGLHKVSVTFQVPVIAENGPPRATLIVPRVQVSRFELRLPSRRWPRLNWPSLLATEQLISYASRQFPHFGLVRPENF